MSFSEKLQFAVSLLASLGVGSAAIFGVAAWFGKLWAGRILEADRSRYAKEIESLRSQAQQEIERQKAEGRTRVFVHRVQFEAEYKAYREIWEPLCEALLATLRLRPMLEYVEPNVGKEELKARKLLDFGQKITALKEAARRNLPFVPAPVATEIDSLLSVLSEEGFTFEDGKDASEKFSTYWGRARENAQKMMEQQDRICHAIRNRMGIVEVAN